MADALKTLGVSTHGHGHVGPFRSVNLTDAWTELGIAGTGSSAVDDTCIFVSTGATAQSAAGRAIIGANGISRGARFDKIDWSKPITIWARLSVLATAANGICQFSLGKSGADGVGNLARRGVAFQVNNVSALAQVHDGTSLTAITFPTGISTITAADCIDARIESNGGGKVSFYMNDLHMATTSAGPKTVTPEVDENYWQIQASNGASAATVSLALFDLQWKDG